MRCDIFCRVIDNYGDIGVCWRLARQLAAEHGVAVTLWVDELSVFAQLAPTLDASAATQWLDGLCVRHWPAQWPAPGGGEQPPADLVIEAFACELPPAYIAAMAACPRPPLWLNLEYLSAESWVEDCHALASPQPASGLVKYFWFPGFNPRTGGLLRERDLLATQAALHDHAAARAAFWTGLGLPDAPGFARRLSLFAYENPACAGLLQALSEADATNLLLVPEGRALADVAAWAGLPRLQAGARLQRGALTLAILPLLSHGDYDRLLACCELNAVRGEDSFVRAQWAGRPLLWHIYPQQDDAHLHKLAAFIRGVEAATAPPALWAEAMRAWNGGAARPGLWPELLMALPQLAPVARHWCAQLAQQPDLAAGVMHFYQSRVE